eukprot:scaffold13786_cov126-Skeletonema_marinoi.AAC.4
MPSLSFVISAIAPLLNMCERMPVSWSNLCESVLKSKIDKIQHAAFILTSSRFKTCRSPLLGSVFTARRTDK